MLEFTNTEILSSDIRIDSLDPTGGKGNEGVEINLRPGDMLAYKGNILEHWRYAFTGTDCVQVFLHYNDVNTPGAEENKYDTRPFIGLPSCLRKK